MMVILAFLIGALLGTRFTVLILVPAITLAVIGVAASGVARGDNVSTIFVAAMLSTICLQVGYLFGAATRYTIARTGLVRSTKPSLRAESAL